MNNSVTAVCYTFNLKHSAVNV